eukprot:TRINITY_DN23408_c0_g1_i1.p1 TRINITY_DN23408_c0_g1~~TRINITY_DN23408_c0_g1_i1.p1  ORF type:complete len:145 (+),score=6.08 TRINITY_DN23408_c0_g1_i1:132-566(+)
MIVPSKILHFDFKAQGMSKEGKKVSMSFGNNNDDMYMFLKGLLDKVTRNRNQIGPKIQQKGKGKKELTNVQKLIKCNCLVKTREMGELVIIFFYFPVGGGWRCMLVVFHVQLVPYIYSSPIKYSSVTISFQIYIYIYIFNDYFQ